MKKTALTKSESEVMYLLWHTDRALSAAEMVALSPQKTWKDSYIHLMVNSLLKKGMIDTADDPASMIDELIVMLQKKREKLAAKKQT